MAFCEKIFSVCGGDPKMAGTIPTEILLEDEIPSEPPSQVVRQKLDSRARDEIRRLHAQYGSAILRQQLNNVGILISCGLAIYFWQLGLWPLAIVCAAIGGHFFHTKPLSMHDASHGTLDPNRRRNNFFGIVCGTAALVPLSVYRFAHAYHHGYMSTEKDPELWPFNQPGTSRPLRLFCAFCEIFLGAIYTPLLFFRSLFTCGTIKKKLRRQIIAGYGLIVVTWGTVFWLVNYFDIWEPFLIGFVLPYFFAGMYQTLNKYTEHMGLLGDTVLSGTRTVIPVTAVNKLASNMIQHVDHHGTHHRFAQIPFYQLPEASEIVYGEESPENPVFRSYWAAFFDMLPTLRDPKVGAQWKKTDLK